jgi:hypothetical protein
MKNFLFSTKDIVKYLIVAGLIYSILKMIPSQQIVNKDLILIMIIIIIGFISVDCVFFKEGKTEEFTNEEDNDSSDLNNNIEELLKKKADLLAKKSENDKNNIELDNSRTKIGCTLEVEKIKRQFENEIDALKVQLQSKLVQPSSNNKIVNKYFESLLNDLADKELLDSNDIENIRIKIRSKLLTMEEIIISLETLKKEGKPKINTIDGKIKDDRIYNELPSDFYSPIGDKIANEWDNEYTILNTNKWQVPMPRPPVCINTTPCSVCPTDSSTTTVNLKQWDDARYVTSNKINKKWAQDQSDT